MAPGSHHLHPNAAAKGKKLIIIKPQRKKAILRLTINPQKVKIKLILHIHTKVTNNILLLLSFGVDGISVGLDGWASINKIHLFFLLLSFFLNFIYSLHTTA